MQQNVKNNIEEIYELTPMQQGMLFHTLYTEGSDTYIEQFCYDLSGKLDEKFFRKAWEEVVSRHGVLRTSFQWKGISKPVQIVSKAVELPWTNLDWSSSTEEQQQSQFKKFLKQDRIDGFSMEKAPIMRCTLIKLSDELYKFVWTFHHILMDGWSYPIIQKEVFTFYEALKEGKQLNLERPKPYKQYIQWLNQQNNTEAEKYWKNQLAGLESPTPMISDSEVRENNIKDIDEGDITFSAEMTEKLKSLAKQNQLTLNTIIQGVWAIILNTYRGENDVLFGGTVSGRTASLNGIEKMVGMFINTLPVRVNIERDSTLISWLKKLQTNHLEREEFSYSSLVDIQEWSEIPRGTQLFDSILVFENYPMDKSLENGVAGIKINNLRAYERTNFPITILIAPGDSLSIRILYETSKFTESKINQLLINFRTLLEGIIKDSSQKISDLSILTDEERNKILFEWNDTKHDFPEDKCVHELFEEQALKNPNGIAAEFEKKTMTYSQLNEKANQVGNYLQKLGAGPDVKIGLCVERSFEMLIGLLGILKSGSAYVPLDSSHPSERLKFLIEDTDAPVLITKQNLLSKLPETNAKIVLLDKDEVEISKESKSNPERKANPSNLAYIIYTSGSTGKPKGVLMKHEALTNLIYWQLNSHKFEKGLRVLQFTTLSFDVSFQEIFSTWYSGGTLVVIKEEDRQDLSKVLSIIKSKKIQRLFLPFIALQEIAELFSIGKDKTLDLKEVITAGEQLQNTPAIIGLFNNLKNFTFSNHYGPSEAHVVTSYTLSNEPDKWMKLPPIGKPIFNTQMFVLNPNLEPVPVGVTGDLYIGGICLVRGYHNRPELTEEKFIDNPFFNVNSNFSRKLYKTGDNARYLICGDLEFLGRTDSQIKLRGYRLELGEIETTLSQFPGMKNVVVVLKEFSAGDKRLVAYYIHNQNTEPPASELKKYLKSKLPDYMVPSDYVRLDEMPLTASGKINQRALPMPEYGRTEEDKVYSEPKDPLELQLKQIWEKVLGIKPIGTRDNFFDLGGHSLLALRLFGYIENLTGRKLSISTLFNSPTIEELAAILKDEGWTPPWKSLVPAKPGGSKLPFFCIPPASGTALHFRELMKYIPDDQPFYILESLGLDGKEQPHYNIEEMAAFYIKEIRTLQPEGPYLLGGRCFGGRVVFEMAQQFHKLGQKVALLAIFDTWPPFIKPQNIEKPKKDLVHFKTSAFQHLKTGQLWKVAWKYSSNETRKLGWRIKNKLEYIFSNKRNRLFKNIMLLHFNAQDRYIAKKYPGKITLIECGTFRRDFRDGWENLAEGGFETYIVPDTNHKTIVKEPHLGKFAEKLNIVLQKTHDEINLKQSANGSVLNNKKRDTRETVNA